MNSEKIVIAIEGIDGAGKTTIINELRKRYANKIGIYKRTKKGKFLDKLVSCQLMKKFNKLQIPIYLFLSYKNYILFKANIEQEVIVMDRCFLSNICYFYPNALFDKKLYERLLFFEIKLYPQTIFILDVSPEVGQKRDNYKKNLNWLVDTRAAYLKATQSDFLADIDIEILCKDISIEEKVEIIIKYIERKKISGN